MKNFEKNYKSVFDKINISTKELEEIRYTLYKNKNNFKIRYAIFCIVVLCFAFTTVVFGKEIVNAIKGFIWESGTVELPNSNGVMVDTQYTKFTESVEIRNESPFNEEIEKDTEFGYAEIENRLGIKILKNPYIKEYIIDNISYNDGKCSTLSFSTSQKNFYTKDDYWYIQIGFVLHTQYASDDEKNQPYGIMSNSEFSTYYINSLDVQADIHTLNTSSLENSPTIAVASFIYNGIAYNVRMMKQNYKLEDLYNILEGFTLD